MPRHSEKVEKSKGKHHLSHKDEVKGSEHSHAHHAKMAKHHLSELHKMAKKKNK